MVNRLVSVGDDFTLPAAVKAADANLPTRLGATALNATIASANTHLQTVGYLGDSLSVNSSYVYGESPHWASVARSLLGHRYADGVKAGIGGQTSAQIRERVGTVVTARPNICIVHAGVNSIAADVSAASVIADLTYIVDELQKAGITPVVLTLIPSSNVTGARLAEAGKVNGWIKALPVAKGVHAIDWRAAVVDFASTTGAWISAWTGDGVHPNDMGGVVLGRVVANGIAHLIKGASPLVSDGGAGGQGLLSLNPGMTGTGGTAGAGVTGTVPAGWTVNPSGTTSTVVSTEPRTDDIGGNWLKLAVTSGTPMVFTQNTAVGVDWAVGDTVWAEMEILMTEKPTNLRGFSFRLDLWNGLGSTSDSTMFMAPATITPLPGRPDAFTLRTKTVVIPAGTGRLQMFLELKEAVASHSGTYRIGRAAIRKQV